jgi:hypothetical protein
MQADAKHDGIVRLVPGLRGQPTPRTLLLRSAQASVSVVGATDYALAVNSTCAPEAAKSYMCSWWHAPHTLDATARSMIGYGGDYTDGWAAFINMGGGARSVGLYNNVGVLFQDTVPWITADKWSKFTIGFFLRYSASDPRKCAALWVDGRLIDVMPAAAWPNGNPAKWIQWGYIPGMGTATSVGAYDNIRVAKSATLYFDAARRIVERDYYDGVPIPNAVAHYKCTEGAGTTCADSLGGAVANMAGASVTWIAGGTIVKPCDG